MNSFASGSGHGRRGGFTLVEMLVAITILALIMVLAAQMIGATSKIWKNTTSKIEAFQSARDGFQLMTDELRQATVNTYWDYFDASGETQRNYSNTADFIPVQYGRQSDLHFFSGAGFLGNNTIEVRKTHSVFFQAPLGYCASPNLYGNLQGLLNGVGFFVQFSSPVSTPVLNSPPSFLPSSAIGTLSTDWFKNGQLTTYYATNVRIVANNVVALIVLPKATDSPTDTLASNYFYDSRLGLASGAQVPSTVWAPALGDASPQPLQMNQMPPIIRVAMVAIDEPSAKEYVGNTTAAPTPSDKIVLALSQSGSGGALFTNGQYMDSDLITLQTGSAGLSKIKPHLNYRIFTTTLTVKSARFSTK
jgi:prepilin-type N-terminal cleavage/methylation domain-containing protein